MIVYFNGSTYDLSNLVVDIQVKQTNDKTFDSASMTIPKVASDYIAGLDMSRPLPRFSRVVFSINEETFDSFIVQTDSVTKIEGTDNYQHEIQLQSVTRLLFEDTNPSLTLTQPQGQIGQYYRTVSTNSVVSLTATNAYQSFSFTTSTQSEDTNILEDRTLKQDIPYKLYFELRLRQLTTGIAIPTDIDFEFVIKADGTTIHEQTIKAKAQNLWQKAIGEAKITVGYIGFTYENVGEQDITVEVRQTDNLDDRYQLSVIASTFYIYSADTQTRDKTTLDYFVEKILHNDINKKKFYLDENSRVVLSKYISPQWTLPPVDKWTQLNEVADYVKAFVRARYEDLTVTSRIIVEFKLFEELDEEQTPPNISYNQSLATVDDYTLSVELNAQNTVYKEGYIVEVVKLRANTDNVSQITTNNIAAVLEYPIDEIVKFEVLLGKSVTNGTDTWNSSTWFDLTLQIIEKAQWDTLLDFAEYTLANRSGNNRKVDYAYFIKGNNRILGLEYTGTQPQKVIGTEDANRALYEMVFSWATREENINVTTEDNGISDDANVQIRVTYKPISITNARLYKDDETGFQAEPSRYINEQSTINDALAIGDYAQGMVNRMGGTLLSFSGKSLISQVPKVSTKYNDYLLTSRVLVKHQDLVSYTLSYVKDYVFVSSYEGYDTRKRLYQIDDNNIVVRTDKFLAKFILDTSAVTEDDNDFEDYIRTSTFYLSYFANWIRTGYSANPPEYAELDFEDSNEDNYLVVTKVDTKVAGNTIEFDFQLHNNYSAGKKRVLADSKYYQQDVRYTDVFGRAEHLKVSLVYGFLFSYDLDVYPEMVTALHAGDIEYTYNIKKDAREIVRNSIQFRNTSHSSDLVIYPMMAQSNRFIKTSKVFTPYVAELDYIPDKNARLIDMTRATQISNQPSLNTTAKTLTINHTNAKPIALYDANTLELMLVDKRELTSHIIHYKGVKL